MTNKANLKAELCRRIEELEYRLACNDMLPNEEEDVRWELDELQEALETLQPPILNPTQEN